MAKDSVGTGTILHKVFKFEGLEIYSERISDLAHLGIESEFWDNSLSSTQNDFLDPPKQKSILILASGLYGAIKVKKKLNKQARKQRICARRRRRTQLTLTWTLARTPTLTLTLTVTLTRCGGGVGA